MPDNSLVTDNLGLVYACCKRFVGRGVEYDDLYQAGCMGLVKASKGFDASRGLCFSTYAVPVILGEMKRLFRDGGTVKVSRSLKELSLKATRVRDEMEKELNREVTVAELAQRLQVSNEDIAQALCAAQPVLSLTYENEDGIGQIDLPVPGVETELADKLDLDTAISNLNSMDRCIVKLRYYQGLTQSQTAARLNMTQVQISRREKKILKILKEFLC